MNRMDSHEQLSSSETNDAVMSLQESFTRNVEQHEAYNEPMALTQESFEVVSDTNVVLENPGLDGDFADLLLNIKVKEADEVEIHPACELILADHEEPEINNEECSVIAQIKDSSPATSKSIEDKDSMVVEVIAQSMLDLPDKLLLVKIERREGALPKPVDWEETPECDALWPDGSDVDVASIIRFHLKQLEAELRKAGGRVLDAQLVPKPEYGENSEKQHVVLLLDNDTLNKTPQVNTSVIPTAKNDCPTSTKSTETQNLADATVTVPALIFGNVTPGESANANLSVAVVRSSDIDLPGEMKLKTHSGKRYENQDVEDTQVFVHPMSCPFCSECWPSSLTLCGHIKTDHRNIKTSCPVCLHKCGTVSSLIAHYRIHSGEHPYECRLCGYRSKVSNHMNLHFLREHSGHKEFVCSVCRLAFEDSEALRLHAKTHGVKAKDINAHFCKVCHMKFTARSHYLAHLQVHRGEFTFKCPICNKGFGTQRYLKSHMLIHENKQFKCSTCDSTFSLERTLRHHEKIHRGEFQYTCKTCNAGYMRKEELNRHVYKEHTKVAPFKCDKCERPFFMQSRLDRHIAECHSDKALHHCNVCNEQFMTRLALRRHQQSHTGHVDEYFRCSYQYCDKKFVHATNLAAHERQHRQAPAHTCETCNKQFVSKKSLVAHELSHTWKKMAFECKTCSVTFSSQKLLSIHESSHGGSYACKYCNCSFEQEQALIYHERLHTGERPFECMYCMKGFIAKDTLELHEKFCDSK